MGNQTVLSILLNWFEHTSQITHTYTEYTHNAQQQNRRHIHSNVEFMYTRILILLIIIASCMCDPHSIGILIIFLGINLEARIFQANYY